MAKAKKQTVSLSTITEVKPSELQEFQGWKEKQEALLKAHPFVSCTDHKSYTEAKKNRTALRTGRTDLNKQEKTLVGILNGFKKSIGNATEELINITLEAENLQQAEIKAYEQKKAEEKAAEEKRKAEELERLKKLRDEQIEKGVAIIDNMTFETIQAHHALMGEFYENIPDELYETDAIDMDAVIESLDEQFQNAIEVLKTLEEQRLERERLKAERKKQEAERKKLEEERKKMEQEKKQMEIDVKLVKAQRLQMECIMFLEEAGYDNPEGDKWVKGSHEISLTILWPVENPTFAFENLEECKAVVAHEAKLVQDRIKAKEQADKESKAKKKLAKLEIEAKMEALKEEADINDIDVVEPFIFPNDLGIESDIEIFANHLKRTAEYFGTVEIEFKTNTFARMWENWNNDIGLIFDQYRMGLEAIQRAKSETSKN